jgi:hypothetical protein
MHSMRVIEEGSRMDLLWLLAGVAFFAGSVGLVHFFGTLRAED